MTNNIPADRSELIVIQEVPQEVIAHGVQEVSLDEEQLKRLEEMEGFFFNYPVSVSDKGTKKMGMFSFNLSIFNQWLFSCLQKNGMELEGIAYRKGVANHIYGFAENFHRLEMKIQVKNCENVDKAKVALAEVLHELSEKVYTKREFTNRGGIDSCFLANNRKHAVFILGTEPYKIKLVIACEEAESYCCHSAECLQVIRNINKEWKICAAPGYDLENAVRLLLIRSFEVGCQKEFFPVFNGLFSYCEQVLNGRLAMHIPSSERLLCEEFVDQYRDPDTLDGSAHLLKGIRRYFDGYTDLEKQAVFFTLENLLSRSAIPDEIKESYCALLRSQIPNWHENKQALILQHFFNNGYYDAPESLLPARYHVQLKEGWIFCELPMTVLEELLKQNTEENIKIVCEGLERIHNVPVSLIEKALQMALKWGFKWEARDLFRAQVRILSSLDNQKLAAYMKQLPADPLGLKSAAPHEVLRHAAECGIHKEWAEIIKGKLLALEKPDPFLVDQLPADSQWKPLFLKAAHAAVPQNFDLAWRLFKKAGKAPTEILESSLRIKTKKGAQFCLDVLELCDDSFSPDLVGAALQQAVSLDDNLMKEQAYLQFWKRIESLAKLSSKGKMQLLKSLEGDPEIAFLLRVIDDNGFHHAEYLQQWNTDPKDGVSKVRQELLLQMIGEPLSFDHLEGLQASARPGWKKEGLKGLSDDHFLVWVARNAVSQELRPEVLARFHKIWEVDPSVCAQAYLKLRPEPLSFYAGPILDALPSGDSLKETLLTAVFEQNFASKENAEDFLTVFEKAQTYCQQEVSFEKILLRQLSKGSAFKGNFSVEIFHAACSFLEGMSVLSGPAIVDLIKKAVATEALKLMASAYFEKHVHIFLALPGSELLDILKKVTVCDTTAELVVQKAQEERKKHVRNALLVWFFGLVKKHVSYSFIRDALILLEKEKVSFDSEQLKECLCHFLSLDLRDPVLAPLGDQIYLTVSLDKELLGDAPQVRQQIRAFILRNWEVFQTAALLDYWKEAPFRTSFDRVREELFEEFTASEDHIQKREAAENKILAFTRFLRLFQSSSGFEFSDRVLSILLINCFKKINKPLLCIPELELVFSVQWENSHKDLSVAMSAVVHECFELLYKEKEFAAIEDLFFKGIKSGLLLTDVIGKIYSTLFNNTENDRKKEFQLLFTQALTSGGYDFETAGDFFGRSVCFS